jgi:plasmid rolling circle replication initiator protein Rep
MSPFSIASHERCSGDFADSPKPKIGLTDLSPRDQPWNTHRSISEIVQSHYLDSDHSRYSARMEFCSLLLDFGLSPDENSTLQLKLRSAKFCRVRHCPVCQWRRSLQWQAKAHEILPKIVSMYPSHRWLFLTLTARHVPVCELRSQLDHLNRSYRRLTQLKIFPGVGWLRSLEVTRSDNGYAHPHFHCLLLVKSSYYGRDYLKHADWVKEWRKCLRSDYDPNVDIRSVKRDMSPTKIIPELLKYCTKESDLIADKEWFLELTTQLHKTRSIATGGILKDFLKVLEEEPVDLIGESEDDTGEDFGLVRFGWKTQYKQYQLVD